MSNEIHDEKARLKKPQLPESCDCMSRSFHDDTVEREFRINELNDEIA